MTSVENIMEKGENVTSIFSWSDKVFYNSLRDFVIKDYESWINSLPNDKILEVAKLEAFTDNKINLTQVMIYVYDRVENNVGKGENAGFQAFSHNVFQRPLS